MKDLSIYFEPVDIPSGNVEGSIGATIEINDEHGFPEINAQGVALMYVPEYRNGFQINGKTNDSFRSSFYGFFSGEGWNGKIYDLGTVRPGETVEDTFFAVAQVITELAKARVIPVVIGGSQDLTLACYKGFEKLEQMINICTIDSKLDIGEPDEDLRHDGYVSHLLMQRPCYLFNFANVGMQRPLVSQREVDLFEKLYFDVCRLGQYNYNYKLSEPYLRNSDFVTIDFSSIKNSETDAGCYKNVNGFYAEQICQLARYSGISDKLNCLGIFNLHPDHNSSSSDLLAQIIWYFIDGVEGRYGDFPIGSRKNYVKFHVHMDEFKEDLVFYKSDKSGRWWMEVKYPAGESGKYERHQLVPCDKEDYEGAMQNRIPNLWWKTLQKLT